MFDAVWLGMAGLLAFGGMAWLALSMEVHWGQAMHGPAEQAVATRQMLRWTGGGSLLLSLLSCLLADRPSIAALVWIMLLAGASMLVSMVLSHRPRWLAPLAGGRWSSEQ